MDRVGEGAGGWDAADRRWLALWLVLFSLLVARLWFVVDDAFISFRFAKHFAAGLGMRFNPGEHVPVEGYSNFLWVVLCAGFEALGLSPVRWAPAASAVCGAVLLGLVHRTLRERLAVARAPATIAAGLFALHPAVAAWSTGGLATMPFSLALFLAADRLLLRERAGLAAGPILLVLALLRVEGVYWAVLLLGLSLARGPVRQRLRALLPGVGVLAVGYGLYFLWRLDVYGELVGNTVTVKGGFAVAKLGRGASYVLSHGLTFVTPFALLPSALLALTKAQRRVGLPLTAMALGVPGYAIVVGGDYMAFGRFLVPGWSFAVLVIGLALQRLHELPRGRPFGMVLGLALLVMVHLPAWGWHVLPASVRSKARFRLNTELFRDELEQWAFQRDHAREWTLVGRGLDRWTEPGARIALSAIGAKGYFSRAFILDTGGLVTRSVAELPPDDRRRSPGHDKSQPVEFFLDEDPDYLQPELHWFVAGRVEDEVAAAVARGRRRLTRAGPKGAEYAVDFRPLQASPAERAGLGEGWPYLVFWRRMEDPEQARRLQQEVSLRLVDLRSDRDPFRAESGHGS